MSHSLARRVAGALLFVTGVCAVSARRSGVSGGAGAPLPEMGAGRDVSSSFVLLNHVGFGKTLSTSDSGIET